eukprot:TRINITY_DN765_c0_g1_i2.p6 TRINITY_DN765_c0_g1~~TRINITY_DN765_c0_g1_i2.p6  ORF type:complete len:132 (+),score=2.48 TRINITY_DN765_c0_g1_i2:241-636(+)
MFIWWRVFLGITFSLFSVNFKIISISLKVKFYTRDLGQLVYYCKVYILGVDYRSTKQKINYKIFYIPQDMKFQRKIPPSGILKILDGNKNVRITSFSERLRKTIQQADHFIAKTLKFHVFQYLFFFGYYFF